MYSQALTEVPGGVQGASSLAPLPVTTILELTGIQVRIGRPTN